IGVARLLSPRLTPILGVAPYGRAWPSGGRRRRQVTRHSTSEHGVLKSDTSPCGPSSAFTPGMTVAASSVASVALRTAEQASEEARTGVISVTPVRASRRELGGRAYRD